MKKFLIPIMMLAFLVAFWNQNSSKPNLLITIFSVVVFMFGMMKLSAKMPSKDQENEDENI